MKTIIFYLYLIGIICILISSCKNEKREIEPVERQEIKSIKMELSDTLFIFNTKTKKQEEKIVTSKELVYTIPNQLPVLTQCGKLNTIEERYDCSNSQLMSYVSKKIRYPEEAYQNEIEGVSVVQFVINENGYPSNEKIVKSIGYGTDQVVLKLIKQMREEGLSWDPGIVKGKKVKVLQTLPVNFKIN